MKVAHRFRHMLLAITSIFLLTNMASTWAAPDCDSDDDGYFKDSGRWCNEEPIDPDDSDPCNPDPEAATCSSGTGGGNDCDLQFDATFYPQPSTDGLRSDTGKTYLAEGGVGFRLYTTGGANSSRHTSSSAMKNGQRPKSNA